MRKTLRVIFSIPFILLGIIYDIIKLPIVLFILYPVFLLLDFFEYLKTGYFYHTFGLDIIYFGTASFIEMFYDTNY